MEEASKLVFSLPRETWRLIDLHDLRFFSVTSVDFLDFVICKQGKHLCFKLNSDTKMAL